MLIIINNNSNNNNNNIKKKLPPSTQTYDQEDRVSLLTPVHRELDPKVQCVPPTLEQNDAGFADPPTNINKHIGSRTNRDASSLQTRRDIGSPKLVRTLVPALKF